jgi:structural maintenance of chromosome 1
VLVQVDAALDATNLDMVTKYVRRFTRPDHEQAAQGVVISLKDKFYECADSLIGVSKTLEKDGSQVFTFDLSAFPEPEYVDAC